jgi:hypothetical protein
MEKRAVPAAPGRLINAVARIGYDTEVALCDLIDNSLDADAKNIRVILEAESPSDGGEPERISRYLISDDGTGMTPNGLVDAFSLGSMRDYKKGCLGKFGLGLKSAGLALGNRIILISKARDAAEATCAILSLADVTESGKYEIDLGAPPEPYRTKWNELCGNYPSGTLLVIDDLNDNQPSHTRFSEYLARYCGNVYHLFLQEAEPISMVVNRNEVKSKDPLFLQEAMQNGSLNPLNWDGTTPHLLLAETSLALNENIKASIAATQLVHPPSFGEKRAEKRDEYAIEADPYTRRARHGFYIYRNRRIIVMAERFYGLISNQTQAWAFRARLMFDETADNILALDVKKRHCQLPRGVRSNLQAIIKNHAAMSREAWEAAGNRETQKRKNTKEDIANESIEQTPIPDLNYAPGLELHGQGEIEARQELLIHVGAQTLDDILDPDINKASLEKAAQEKSVVISAKGLRANAMWLPYPATSLGAAETLVNTQHSWVAEAYAAAEDDPVITLILHQFLTILARAELEMRATPWREFPDGVVEKVMDRFRKKASAIAEDLAESLAAQIAKFLNQEPTIDE